VEKSARFGCRIPELLVRALHEGDMDVRLATERDVAQFRDLMRHVYAAFGEGTPRPERLTEFFMGSFRDPARFQFIVAEERGRLVGILSLAFCPTTYRTSTFAFLDDLHVLEEARGRGVGRALLDFAQEHAATRGAVE